MKRIAAIFALMAAFNVHALIANNLVADWQGGAGVTASGGRISQWTDQHQLLTNDNLGPYSLTQTNPAYQPYDVSDAQACRGVMFPWGFSTTHPHTCLNVPVSLGGLNATNTTVYVVATGPANQENQSLIWFGGSVSGWIRFYLTGNYPTNYPANLFAGQQSSTIYPPINRAIFVVASDNTKTTMRWNNVVQTGALQPATAIGSGGMVGANTNDPTIYGYPTEFYSGVIYRILVYNAAHTAAQMDAQVAELAAIYGVLTNYTKQAVCRGDSITAGVASTMLQSYPFQLCERYPEIEWHNQGIGSMYIGPDPVNRPNGNTMYEVDGFFVDPLYDGKLQQNWLFFFGGINDINAGVSGAVTYGRLTNYVAARKAACPWKVVVSTIQSDTTAPAAIAIYNALMRTNGGGWDVLTDPGLNSPIETRFNNSQNTNYFAADGMHFNNVGYGILAGYFAQTINVPHRTTGFFGP